jgi:hypothetical protein
MPFSAIARPFLHASVTAVFGILVGCESSPLPSAGIRVTETDSAGITIVTISGDPTLLPELRLREVPSLAIEGSREPFFSRIGEVEWLPDGRVVVEDNQHDGIYLFADDGTYLRQLGGQGDGPGQFQNMTEMTVLPNDSVFLYDRTHPRLSVMDPDSGFVRSVRFGSDLGGRPPLDVFALSPDRFIVQASVAHDTDEEETLPRLVEWDALLFLTDGVGQVVAGPVAFSGSYEARGEGLSAGPIYSHRAIVAVRPGRFVHGSGKGHELTVRSAGFEPLLMIRWDGWSGPVPGAELERFHEEFLSSSDQLPPGIRESFEEAIFSSRMQPERRPALSWRSYIDELGRIWLSRFFPERLRDEVEPEWHVLDEDGRPLARLALPTGATLVAVRADRVMFILADEVGVQSLYVHEIQGPPS